MKLGSPIPSHLPEPLSEHCECCQLSWSWDEAVKTNPNAFESLMNNVFEDYVIGRTHSIVRSKWYDMAWSATDSLKKMGFLKKSESHGLELQIQRKNWNPKEATSRSNTIYCYHGGKKQATKWMEVGCIKCQRCQDMYPSRDSAWLRKVLDLLE